jgi:hypothetical protein
MDTLSVVVQKLTKSSFLATKCDGWRTDSIANAAIIVHQHAADVTLFQQHLAMDNALKQ